MSAEYSELVICIYIPHINAIIYYSSFSHYTFSVYYTA